MEDDNEDAIASDICFCNSNKLRPVEQQILYGNKNYQVYHSELCFIIPDDVNCLKSNCSSTVQYDDDGDLIIKRQLKRFILQLDHCISTPISLVGLQVWSASLFLADYLLYSSKELKEKYILELGSGLGICSMISALFASKVFCTDAEEEILYLCEKNIQNFINDFKDQFLIGNIYIKELNWFKSNCFPSLNDSKFYWSEEEKNLSNNISLYIASDVVYDNEITLAFFKVIKILMENTAPSQLFLTLEKRMNFTLDVLDITCPFYDFFLNQIELLKSDKNYNWNIYRDKKDFPQYFQYDRNNQLELWIFKCKKL